MERVQATTTGRVRKRKAENQDNERLSKRLSLLNLERNGQKLYVPVEQPTSSTSTPTDNGNHASKSGKTSGADDMMQVDSTKHKVYIYDLDAELSDSESSDDGKLIFLPDISKHLRETRIPPQILANSEGELAGNNQLVLYNVPSSLTVPEERDSVRKAIIESRARMRLGGQVPEKKGLDARDWYQGMVNGTGTASFGDPVSLGVLNGVSNANGALEQQVVDDDPDAMDLG